MEEIVDWPLLIRGWAFGAFSTIEEFSCGLQEKLLRAACGPQAVCCSRLFYSTAQLLKNCFRQ